MGEAELKIPKPLWLGLVKELRARGNMGKRESGALLLAGHGSSSIKRFICYDELDPHAFDTGIVRFDTSGFVPLWKICEEEGLRVVADVHTHPRGWTGQSKADIMHPVIHKAGHLALIIPNCALGKQGTLKGVGIYRYLGAYRWETIGPGSKAFKIIKNET